MNRSRVKELLPTFEEIVSAIDRYWERVESGHSRYEIHEEVYKLIDKLDYYDVLLVESVMYIGRDDYLDPDSYAESYDYYRELERFYDDWNSDRAIKNLIDHLESQGIGKQTAILHMLEKRPLSKYLLQGLDVLKLKRIETKGY